MPGIGIVTNPNSRRNRRNPTEMHRLGFILGSDDDRHVMTRSPDDIREVAERFLDREVDILALNGGDGTNHVTLTAFLEVYGETPLPKIAFLRGGTMNTISNAVGVRGTPGSILLNLTEKYHTDRSFEITERPILKIDSDAGAHYGFIFGNGLIYNYLKAYYEYPNPNPVVAARVLGRILASSLMRTGFAEQIVKPFNAQVDVDGDRWPYTEYTAVVASTIEQIGLGFRPFIRCRQQPGHFNLLGILCNATEFGMALPRIRLGQPVEPEKMRNEVAKHVVFESSGTIEYTIDGDLHTSDGPVTLSAGPTLQIIVR